MILVENHDFPYASFELYFGGGSLVDPPGKEGLVYMMGQMLLRGTAGRSQAELAEAIDRLGGAIEVSVAREYLVIEGDALARNLDEFVALLGEILSSPRFDPAELDKVRRQTIAENEELRDSDEELASHIFYQALYQPDSAWRPVKGTTASLDRITVDDLKAAYAQLLQRKNLLIGVAGDVDPARLEGRLKAALSLPDGAPAQEHVFGLEDPGTIKVILVDKPDRTQSQIYLGHVGVSAQDPDFFPLLVANTLYGGTFTARLSHEIREKRGWSYGAYSYLAAHRAYGTFSVRFYPKLADTLPALALGLRLQKDLVQKGVTDAEVVFAKSYLTSHFPFRLQTPRRRLHEGVKNHLLGLPDDATETWVGQVEAVTTDQVNQAISRHLKFDDLTVVVVCTASKLLDGVKALEGVGEVLVHPFDRDWPAPEPLGSSPESPESSKKAH